MTALAFDTCKAVRALREAGFEEARAEAVVATVGAAMGGDVAAREHVAAEVARFRADMYRLVLAAAVGIVGLTVALVKLLP